MLSGKDRGVLRAIEQLLSEHPDTGVTAAELAARKDWDPAEVAGSFRKLTAADCVEPGRTAQDHPDPLVVARLSHRGRRERGH
jgi:hypothetical protein